MSPLPRNNGDRKRTQTRVSFESGHDLHIFKEQGEWKVWLNTEAADFDGLCISLGATKLEALEKALFVFGDGADAILDALGRSDKTSVAAVIGERAKVRSSLRRETKRLTLETKRRYSEAIE